MVTTNNIEIKEMMIERNKAMMAELKVNKYFFNNEL